MAKLNPIGFPLHQLPRGPSIRRMVMCPPGWSLVEFDAAGQEARIMADYSRDELMLKVFREGLDYHSVTGAAISPHDYQRFMELKSLHDESIVGPHGYRYCGKFVNLSCQYRIGDRTLRTKARVDYDLNVDLGTARYWRHTFLGAYWGIPEYWRQAIRIAQQHGYAETRAGRRMGITEWDKEEMKWASESTAINFPIQGTGADMKELAITTMARRHPEFLFAWDLHDGLFYWVRDDVTTEDILEARKTLDNLDYPAAWGWEPAVPMVWDAAIMRDNWGEKEEV